MKTLIRILTISASLAAMPLSHGKDDVPKSPNKPDSTPAAVARDALAESEKIRARRHALIEKLESAKTPEERKDLMEKIQTETAAQRQVFTKVKEALDKSRSQAGRK